MGKLEFGNPEHIKLAKKGEIPDGKTKFSSGVEYHYCDCVHCDIPEETAWVRCENCRVKEEYLDELSVVIFGENRCRHCRFLIIE